MQYFSIKDIENLSGIKAHTIRAWEQRYPLRISKRDGGQHRTYSNDDLKEFLRISLLYHKGFKISKITALSEIEVENLIQKTFLSANPSATAVHRLIEASIDFDKTAFEEVVNLIIEKNGIEKSIKEIFYPYLQRIGLLWLTNHAIPAQEHFASHILRKKIITAIDKLGHVHNSRKKILIFTPTGEYHELPILIANYIFRKNGISTVYFGVNVSTDSLVYYLKVHHIDYLYTHIITFLNQKEIEDYILSLKKIVNGTILLSGDSFKSGSLKNKECICFKSIDEMIGFAIAFKAL